MGKMGVGGSSTKLVREKSSDGLYLDGLERAVLAEPNSDHRAGSLPEAMGPTSGDLWSGYPSFPSTICTGPGKMSGSMGSSRMLMQTSELLLLGGLLVRVEVLGQG